MFFYNLVNKIWIYPYELHTKKTKQIRNGCLLKVEFTDSSIGHSDLHPWPEKQEPPLHIHLQALKNKNFTNLCTRAIYIAQHEAKFCNINLLSGLKIPLSHYLILDIETFNNIEAVLNKGFRVFKVKLKHPLKSQTKKLITLIKELSFLVKWRIDFSPNLTQSEWEQWTQEFLPQINSEHLDFIEIPIEYKESLGKINKKYCLAVDVWGKQNTLPIPVIISKSSRKTTAELLKTKSQKLFHRVVFTHSLSHPMDQLASAYFATQFYKIYPQLTEVCGLVQTDIYENHEFTLLNKGPQFPRFCDTGWGLSNTLLNRLKWKKWVF